MKKKLISVVLGLVFAAVPMVIFATCQDLVIIDGTTFCTLTSSATVNGHEVCSYSCSRRDQDVPVQ